MVVPPLPSMEAQERQGGNIPGVPADPPPLGFLSHYFPCLGPAGPKPHVPCAHGEHQETTTCPLTQSLPLTIPQPPR